MTNIFLISAVIYLFSSIIYIFYIVSGKENFKKLAFLLTIVGFCAQTFGLVLWTIKAHHPPFSNLYESTIFFSWAIILVYIILKNRYQMDAIGAFVTPLAFLAIGAASVLPSNYKDITPLVPALQSYWLHIHVVTCMLGYGAFAVSFIGSIIFLLKLNTKKGSFLEKLPSLESLDIINYKSIVLGFLFLGFGIISGSIWANQAWGTYWGWDPKETWSLITWFIYAIYIHARFLKGWQGKKTAYLSIIGFIAVLFTYWGVNLLLSGLHSYSK